MCMSAGGARGGAAMQEVQKVQEKGKGVAGMQVFRCSRSVQAWCRWQQCRCQFRC